MEKVLFVDPKTLEKIEFVIEEETMVNGFKYLLVSEPTDTDECDAYILKEIQTDEEETLYEMVEDDVEFSAIAKVFFELADEDTKLEY